MNIGISDGVMRNLFWLICVASAVAIFKSGRQFVGSIPALKTGKRGWVFGIALQCIVIALCLLVDDPFGFISRLVFIGWFAAAFIPRKHWAYHPLYGGRRPSVCIGVGTAAVLCWYFLAYENWENLNSLAVLLIVHLLLQLWQAPSAFDYQRNPLAQIVVAGSIAFALLRDQAWWIRAVGQEWSTPIWSVWWLGCIASIGLLVALLNWVMSFIVGIRPQVTTQVLVSVGPLLIFGIGVGQFLPVAISWLQDELYVLWDPFNRGWRPFGPEQGVTARLMGDWVDQLRAAVIVASTVISQWVVASVVKKSGYSQHSALPLIFGVSALGYGALYWLGGA